MGYPRDRKSTILGFMVVAEMVTHGIFPKALFLEQKGTAVIDRPCEVLRQNLCQAYLVGPAKTDSSWVLLEVYYSEHQQGNGDLLTRTTDDAVAPGMQ